MINIKIADRFTRSVELEFDFQKGERSRGYIVTAKARELLTRISTITQRSGGAALSVIGTYGSGKSAFALYAAMLLSGDGDAQQKLSNFDEKLSDTVRDSIKGGLFPILVTGRRESFGRSILRGLFDATERLRETKEIDGSDLESLADEIWTLQSSDSRLLHEDIERVFTQLHELVAAELDQGVFLVIDELGKLLEFAALHPRESDVYTLQLLAEKAVRQGDKDQNHPFVFLTILHQAIERYATRLVASQQEEWRKVQGRFEDFAFQEPVDETIRLLDAAIETDTPAKESKQYYREISSTLELAKLPAHVDKEVLRGSLEGAVPLSPAVALIVGPIFRKLAQNERSLFAFLASREPDGFTDVLTRQIESDERPIYRLHHLYDYLQSAIGPTLLHGKDSLYWAEVDSAIRRFDGDNRRDLELLKTIALLSFAGSFGGLTTTSEVLSTVSGFADDEVDPALSRLKDERFLTYRPFSKEYSIWQGSDFDIDDWMRRARAEISPHVPLADLLAEVDTKDAFIARRHSYETGVARHLEKIYVSGSQWLKEARTLSKKSDGKLLYLVPDDRTDHKSKIDEISNYVDELPSNIVIALLPDLSHIRAAAYDAKCYEWISENCDELSGDPAARKELSQRKVDTKSYIRRELTEVLNSQSRSSAETTWFVRENIQQVGSARQLQTLVSDLFDELFDQSPRVWNELLNRRKPSSSAVRAQKQLLVAMFEDGEREHCGIDGTPAEYGLYAAVLQAGKLHVKDGSTYKFTLPEKGDDPLNLRPILREWSHALVNNHGQRISVGELAETAERRPYGLRKGLFPVLFLAYVLASKDQIALYEDGAFVIDVGAFEIDRFIKGPDRFDVQYITIDKHREELLQKYGQVVGLESDETTILSVVTELLRRARTLTPYARRTGNLDSRDTAVREALFRAEDPIKLLFEEIPVACGFESQLSETTPDIYDEFRAILEASLRAVSNSYNALLNDLQDEIASALLVHAIDPEGRRTEISERSANLLPHATNEQLKAFLVRATDAVMDTPEWFDSLSALLAGMPTKQWIDRTRDEFRLNLREVARAFRTLEPLVFDEDTLSNSESSTASRKGRISLTSLGADEEAFVYRVHPEDESLITVAADAVRTVLRDESPERPTDFKIAVIAEALHGILEQMNEEENTLESTP